MSKDDHKYLANLYQEMNDVLVSARVGRNFATHPTHGSANMSAAVEAGTRYILVGIRFPQELSIRLKDSNIGAGSPYSWTIRGILAHEIGHHVLGHTISNHETRHLDELQADEYAGAVLARMGATEEQARTAVTREVPTLQSDPAYPDKADRLAAVTRGWKSSDEDRRPVVVLMDSSNPDLVYDRETRSLGGTNADDIHNAIKDLRIEIRKEHTSLMWSREAEILAWRPALVVAHLSCFYESTNVLDGDARFESLVKCLKRSEATKFIVYTRGVEAIASEDVRRRWESKRKYLDGLEAEGRLRLMSLKEDASFRRTPWRSEIHDMVAAMVGNR